MEHQQFDIPIVLFVFRRLDTVKLIMQKLHEVQPKVLYIFSDGARQDNEKEEQQIESVRRYISTSIDWACNIYTEYAEKNKGCANNICSGLDKVFQQERYAIVLEDDAVPMIEFFFYCKELLLKYENDKMIQYIAGFNCIGDDSCIKDSYAYAKTAGMSGAIALWADRWNDADLSMRDWPEYRKRGKLKQYYYSKEMYHISCQAFDDSYKNVNDGWDYQFQFDQLNKGRYAIVPRGNLARSYGYAEGAFHPQGKKEAQRLIKIMDYTQKKFLFPMQHPQKIELNREYDKIRQKYYLRVKGNYIERHIYYMYRKVKDIIYRFIPHEIWNLAKKILK